MENWQQTHFWATLLFSVALLVVVAYLAYRKHFFRLPPKEPPYPLKFSHVVGAFGTYFVISMLFFPIVLLLARRGGEVRLEIAGWLQLVYLVVLCGLLIGYLCMLKGDVVPTILFGKNTNRFKTFFRGLGMGALAWCVSYPFVLVTNLIASRFALEVWDKNGVEQTAVQHLKKIMDHHWLYTFTIFAVVLIVPFMEELLFRGFLQTWLRRFLGRMGALLLTAFIFAVVHFSMGLGTGNFELLLSLFVLSLFLGFIYERERTLWAPFALHAIFNGVTVIALALAS